MYSLLTIWEVVFKGHESYLARINGGKIQYYKDCYKNKGEKLNWLTYFNSFIDMNKEKAQNKTNEIMNGKLTDNHAALKPLNTFFATFSDSGICREKEYIEDIFCKSAMFYMCMQKNINTDKISTLEQVETFTHEHESEVKQFLNVILEKTNKKLKSSNTYDVLKELGIEDKHFSKENVTKLITVLIVNAFTQIKFSAFKRISATENAKSQVKSELEDILKKRF